MKRTYRLSGVRRFSTLTFAAVGLCLAVLFVLDKSAPPGSESPIERWVLLGVLLGLVGFLLLDLIFARVLVDDHAVTVIDKLNRKRAEFAFEDLTGYSYGADHRWRLASGEQEVRLPEIDVHEFHLTMATRAPRALNAKPWRCGQVPPAKEYADLLMFSFRRFFVRLFGAILSVSFLFWAFHSGAIVIGLMAETVVRTIYSFKGFFERLSITDEGISLQSVLHRRALRWEDVIAVFREGSAIGQRFVLTGGDTAIAIPSHIARDGEIMRKMFYSLPDGTLCVNFSPGWQSGFRGPRRRRLQAPASNPLPDAVF